MLEEFSDAYDEAMDYQISLGFGGAVDKDKEQSLFETLGDYYHQITRWLVEQKSVYFIEFLRLKK